MKLIDVVQRLKLVSDYDQCRKAMDDAIDEITKLREQVTAYDKWLSEGVYFTTDEYIAECRRVNKELALRDLENMKLREALCKATRSLYGMQVPKYYSDLIDETFTPAHLQEWYQGMVGEPVLYQWLDDTCNEWTNTTKHYSATYDEDYAVRLLHAPKEFKA